MSQPAADPAPAAPAPPPFVPMSWPATLGYIGASVTIGLTQGLAQGFVSTNIPQIAGDLGATTTQASWLMAAFMIPRASMPILLIKIRTQFGLRRFAEVAILVYLAVSLAAFAISDLRSAVTVQFFAGMASAPLSTLAFMYMLEPLPPAWKMRLGLPMVLAMVAAGPMLARVISPALMGDHGWDGLHVMALGMAAVSLGLVYALPLASQPRVKVIAAMDLVSWLLIATGFGGLTVAFVMGSIYWWTDVAWLGWVLALAIVALTLAVVIELHRKAPLLDIRWLASPAMLHLTATLLIFRLVLSEQSSGAPRMFQVLGVTQDQLVPLFALISAATVLGGLALIPFMKPERVPLFHIIALALIAAGAFMDSHATIDTRPAQMMLSQAMIAFAGSLFLAPAMMRGLLSALARGPNYILSFVIVFLSTQSLGGAVGSGLFSTLINHRQALHLQVLREELTAADPLTAAEIAQRSMALAPQIADAAQRQAQAVAQIAQDAGAQAYVMAYNDAYFLTFLVAAAALCALLLHLFRDWLVARRAPLPAVAQPLSEPKTS
ncbi:MULTISPECIES: MFS transporter [unclassified Paracoccus (in: a-proteobacteria)]|uniref:MFS transporter n=1 Tax=unclassified Paracoccus (in: a-proteobacteria) TaxID=2688777 RepID=UPI0004AD48A3|nr:MULTISPECIES: MFS transporter [unclassified Paracoccus (in: a-proteobacteria)]